MASPSVVVVNWNAGPALAHCLDSVADVDDVVVVDNASTDASHEAARGRPNVRLIESGENLGFAGGANRGATATRGDVIVFLNPDARALPGAVRMLVDALVAAPEAGIAGGGLARADGSWEPGAAHFPPVRHLLLDTTLGRRRASRRRDPHRVDWVYGTFMAVRTDVFQTLRGFDARYFVYGEDMDLCWRAARRGIATLHVPGARAVHGANVSATQRFGRGREAEVVKGEMRFYATVGRGALARFRAVAVCKFGVKAAVARVRGRNDVAETYARVVRACVSWRPAWSVPTGAS